jgi:hypothetical protein
MFGDMLAMLRCLKRNYNFEIFLQNGQRAREVDVLKLREAVNTQWAVEMLQFARWRLELILDFLKPDIERNDMFYKFVYYPLAGIQAALYAEALVADKDKFLLLYNHYNVPGDELARCEKLVSLV